MWDSRWTMSLDIDLSLNLDNEIFCIGTASTDAPEETDGVTGSSVTTTTLSPEEVEQRKQEIKAQKTSVSYSTSVSSIIPPNQYIHSKLQIISIASILHSGFVGFSSCQHLTPLNRYGYSSNRGQHQASCREYD